jgi:hypothetical protein
MYQRQKQYSSHFSKRTLTWRISGEGGKEICSSWTSQHSHWIPGTWKSAGSEHGRVLSNPLAVLEGEPTTDPQCLPHLPGTAPPHARSCPNPIPSSSPRLPPGQSRILRGHMSKYNRRTADWKFCLFLHCQFFHFIFSFLPLFSFLKFFFLFSFPPSLFLSLTYKPFN